MLLTKLPLERLNGARAIIVRLAGIQSQCPLDREVVMRLPSGKRREVMGVEGNESVRGIVRRPDKRAVVAAFEHHHLVGPDAPCREPVAKSIRHGAEVFADGDAILIHALLRDNAEQRVERHLHIHAIPRRCTRRNEIKPVETEDVIEPYRSGKTHRGAYHLAERRKVARFQSAGIESREPPVLPGRVELIGRRADRQRARDSVLLVPGIESAGLHANGDIEIKSD